MRAQVCGGLPSAADLRAGGEELLEVVVVEIRIGILVELALPRIVGLELDVQAVVVGDAIARLVDRRFAGERAHQFVEVFEFSQCFPTSVTRSPVEARCEPDRKGFCKILVGVALGIPVVQVHHVGTAIRARPVKLRLLGGRQAEGALPLLFLVELIGVGTGVRGLVSHQPHEPFRRFPFHLEDHLALQSAQPVVHQKKRNENRRDADRNKPFVADVAGQLENQAFPR